MKVIITGESHTAALKKGKKLMEKEGDPWPSNLDIVIRALGGGDILATSFFVDCGDYAEIIEESCRNRFTRLPLPETHETGIIYGLCAPLHTARIWRHHDWIKYAPAAIVESEAPVSHNMMKRIILDDQQYILALIDILKRTNKKLFVIEAPRPFLHHDAFSETRKEVIASIDNTYRRFMRDEFARRSVPVVSIPSKCISEDGFMLETYRSEREGDEHHGNALFGRIMLREVIGLLREWPS